jgi:hypothetical protein
MIYFNINEHDYFTAGLYRLLYSTVRYSMIYDIFIYCNWVVTRWQYTFTHKQYIKQHK